MSGRKALSNQKNATRSTGPRTRAGKTKSSRNAYRHGLATDVRADPKLSAEVEKLARQLAGVGADKNRMASARVVAAAQADSWRISNARSLLLERLLRASEQPILTSDEIGHFESVLARQDVGSLCGDLARLERYRRRAFSREMKGMYEFLGVDP